MALKSKSTDNVRADLPLDDVAPAAEPVRVNLIVPDTLREKWKIIAAKRRTNVTQLILEAMSNFVSAIEAEEKKTEAEKGGNLIRK